MRLQALRQLWALYNSEYFGSKLKPIVIRLTRARGYWGKYVYHTAGNGSAIYLSGNKNKTQADFQDSLRHEMVHQYLRECQGDIPEEDHGPLFELEAIRVGLKPPWNPE